MTMEELARQENLAVRNHWRAGAFDQPDAEREIAARIPNNWYGPEKTVRPYMRRPGAIGLCRRKKPCRCSACN